MIITKNGKEIITIGFSGVPGTGKSSLARAMSGILRYQEWSKNLDLVSEYARRYIAKYGKVNSVGDQYRLLEKQLDWESSICNDKLDIMITDSPIFLGMLYSWELRNPNDLKDTITINDIYKKMNKVNCPIRYDIIFHIPPIVKPVDDGIRDTIQLTDDWRKRNDERLRFIFEIFPPNHFIEIQSIDILDRVEECKKHIMNIYEGNINESKGINS